MGIALSVTARRWAAPHPGGAVPFARARHSGASLVPACRESEPS